MSPSVLGWLASSQLVLISTALSPPLPVVVMSPFDLALSSFLCHLTMLPHCFLSYVSSSSWPSVFLCSFHASLSCFFPMSIFPLVAQYWRRLSPFSCAFPCFPFRCYHLGGHDLRWEAIRRDLHQRHSRPAGKGRASPSATNLHNRRLHGHGEMYVCRDRHTCKLSFAICQWFQ